MNWIKKIGLLLIITSLYSIEGYSKDLVMYYEKTIHNLSLEQKNSLITEYHFNANDTFYIEAYSDEYGSNIYNNWLSLKRAEGVRDFLFEKFKVPLENITTIGKGKDNSNLPPNQKRRCVVKTNYLPNELVKKTNSSTNNIDLGSSLNTSLSDANNNVIILAIDNLNQRISKIENTTLNNNNKFRSIAQDEALDAPEEKVQIQEKNKSTYTEQNIQNIDEEKKSVNKAEEATAISIINNPSNNKNEREEEYKYEFNVNTYSASESGKYSNISFIDGLNSNTRLSFDFILRRNLNSKFILFYEAGLKWNSFSKDIGLNVQTNWDNFAFLGYAGLEHKIKNIYKNSYSLGLKQIPSHFVDGLGVVTYQLQALTELKYNLLIELYNKNDYVFEIGPTLGFDLGLSDIKTGYLFGLYSKLHFNKDQKYHIQLKYEDTTFKQDLRTVNLRTLELGFGYKY